jgi:prophage regulatory protein
MFMTEKSTKPATQVAITPVNGEATKPATPATTPQVNADESLLRIKQVLAKYPVSRSHLWAEIAKGKFPRGIKLSARVTVWKSSDIQALISSLQ